MGTPIVGIKIHVDVDVDFVSGAESVLSFCQSL